LPVAPISDADTTSKKITLSATRDLMTENMTRMWCQSVVKQSCYLRRKWKSTCDFWVTHMMRRLYTSRHGGRSAGNHIRKTNYILTPPDGIICELFCRSALAREVIWACETVSASSPTINSSCHIALGLGLQERTDHRKEEIIVISAFMLC
jgi:hypothetical protein